MVNAHAGFTTSGDAAGAVSAGSAAERMPRARRTALTLAAALISVLLVVLLSGCSSKPPVVASADAASVDVAATITVKDMAFSPAEVTIKPGQAVTWVFDDGVVKHDVVAADGSFVSELMAQGSYTHVFTEAGSFDYGCSPHPRMLGVVTVE
ncbi:plastocyanin/azurin family copper-binding protein [Microterricola pindariensis]|nr:plastocyanin/azurin family copper-binding protein [Microterricola pindariensis]